MRDNIPKDILDRCTFKVDKDNNESISAIKPLEDCPCGRVLDDVRRVRLAKTKEPQPHWREYCSTCKLVSVRGANDWKLARDLNAEMRTKNYFKDK